MDIEGLKIVEAKEMALIESLAYQEGASEEEFMLAAGKGIAEVALVIYKDHHLEHIYLVIGKGNNGGDAYVAGQEFLDQGIPVIAYQLFDLSDCSPLCQKHHEAFLAKGGKVIPVQSPEDLKFERGLILDGILGTGFQGELKEPLLKFVEKINASHQHVVAIDIPSGVNGNTGEVLSEAIAAEETIFLGLAKLGFFIRQGFDHVGKLIHVDFGLGEKYIQQASEFATLLADEISQFLPVIKRVRHKYEAGYVLGVAGSPGMGGAAKLASLSSLRAGAGIVKLFYPKEAEDEMKTAPLELVRFSMDRKDLSLLLGQMKSAKAAFIGPGMGREKETAEFLKNLLPQITIPAVLDADALYFLSEYSDTKLSKDWILTPHRNEMLRLLGQREMGDELAFLSDCQKYAEKKGIVLVVKGAPTWIFASGKKPLVMARGDPGMATAGTGDVLTGILAALLVQGLDPYVAAALGTYLHAVSGEIVAKEKTSYSLIASDLIDALPAALKEFSEKENR